MIAIELLMTPEAQLVDDILAPLRRLAGARLSSVLAFDGSRYRVPPDWRLPAVMAEPTVSRYFNQLLVRYVETVSPVISFVPGGDAIELDETRLGAEVAGQLGDAAAEAGRTAGLLRHALETPEGQCYLAGLIMAEKKRPDFDQKDLYARAIEQLISRPD